jgi:hydroxymethylbilane synthase
LQQRASRTHFAAQRTSDRFADSMPHAPRRLTIVTRGSALDLLQAESIRARLAALHAGAVISVLRVPVHDDRIGDPPPSSDGAREALIKELELAMEEGRADLAIHALKDVPMELSPGFTLAAIVAREDPRDAFVSVRYTRPGELPPGAVVGTSSPRREAQVRELYPHLTVESLHGNVNTRLRALDAGRYDAIIVAASGLKRMGFATRIASLLEPDECLPAPGQGALAIECRTDRPDLVAALEALGDRATTLATTAERAFSRAFGGSCALPLAAYAEWEEGSLWLRGLVAKREGSDVLRGERDADVADAESASQLGRELADDFLARGASRFLSP